MKYFDIVKIAVIVDSPTSPVTFGFLHLPDFFPSDDGFRAYTNNSSYLSNSHPFIHCFPPCLPSGRPFKFLL